MGAIGPSRAPGAPRPRTVTLLLHRAFRVPRRPFHRSVGARRTSLGWRDDERPQRPVDDARLQPPHRNAYRAADERPARKRSGNTSPIIFGPAMTKGAEHTRRNSDGRDQESTALQSAAPSRGRARVMELARHGYRSLRVDVSDYGRRARHSPAAKCILLERCEPHPAIALAGLNCCPYYSGHHTRIRIPISALRPSPSHRPKRRPAPSSTPLHGRNYLSSYLEPRRTIAPHLFSLHQALSLSGSPNRASPTRRHRRMSDV